MSTSLPPLHEIESELARATLPQAEPLRISVLRNIMLEPLEPYLRYLLRAEGRDAALRLGEYDTIAQEALADPGGLISRAQVVLVFLHLWGASEGLSLRYAQLQPEARQAEADRLDRLVQDVLRGIRNHTDAPILWQGFELPGRPALGLADANSPQSQTKFTAALNDCLRQRLAETPGAFLVDLDRCQVRVGAEQFYDHRLWHMARAPYSRAAYQEIAAENARAVRAVLGRARKCLVLDCDNTLWGGVVGEDGLKGIALGQTHPGSCYAALQHEALNLFHRGVILALCSKNNEEDVWEVFDQHPDMVLRREHLAAWRIDWRDKAANLESLAKELNIGLDSMVFVDDSAHEAERVRQALPQVEVLHLPPGKPAEYARLVRSCGLFDTLAFSAEDLRRGHMYSEQRQRRQAREQAPDLDSYLRSLEMEATVGLADDFSLPRVSQLTLKTNQFNLTTRRYAEAEIDALRRSGDHDVLTLALRDRFGDSGLVGAAIVRYAGDRAVIDTFLLSCRVLGRGVEDVLLAALLRRAAARGCAKAVGEYLPTRKNSQVEHFYEQRGFARMEPSGPEGGTLYERALGQGLPEMPAHFKTINVPVQGE